MVNLIVYVTNNCDACKRAISSAHSIQSKFDNVHLEIKNIANVKSKVAIVPAIFINQNLFCYGEFDVTKLINAILTIQ